jgi:archaemetzincin
LIVSTEYSIVICPIGNLDGMLLKQIGKKIRMIFGWRTKLICLVQDIEFALDPQRNQYHSTPILEKLANNAPPNTLKVLAVTDVDLFIPILTHVYGEAQLGGKACIISTCRLKDTLSTVGTCQGYRHRVIKEAIHELGHTFKLRHCPDSTCIMHYCRTVMDVDRKTDRLCRYCEILLQDEIMRLEEKK